MPLYQTPSTTVGGTPSPTFPGSASSSGGSASAADLLHQHESPGGYVANTGNQTVSGTTNEVSLIPGGNIGANFLKAGTTIRLRGRCSITTRASATSVTFRVRIGTTTLTGAIVITLAKTVDTTATNPDFLVDADVTIRTGGPGGTVTGELMLIVSDSGTTTGPFTTQGYSSTIRGATVSVDCTQNLIVELTAQFANVGNAMACYVGYIEVVKM